MLLRVVEETIFHSQYFWFYCFGILILVYIVLAVYHHIKHPKQNIKSIRVKVESVKKVCVQAGARNAGADGILWSGRATISGTRFEVEFTNEKTNETICLSINEKECEKLKAGDRGVLKYNGDEYISFQQGPESKEIKEPFYHKFVKNKKIALFFVLGLVIVGGAIYFLWKINQEKEITIEETDDTTLKVYLVGANGYGDGELSDSFYQTYYLLGEFLPTASRRGQEGYIFNKGIKEYSKKFNREIEATYFHNTRTMLETAYNDWKNGQGPDVIVGEYTQSGYCLYPYMEERMLADLSPYFEMDEVYTGGEYIPEVLRAGKVNDTQLVFPLTFNMNLLYTSEERQERHERWLSNDMTYDELMKVFDEGWQEYGKSEEYLLLQFTNMFPNDYPYLLFQAASGECPIDYETGQITLSKESFEEWARLYESFICDDFDMDREELKRSAQQNGGNLSYDLSGVNDHALITNGENVLDMYEILCKDALCIAEGGNSSYQLHSFAANAGYYESRFSDDKEHFECIGIPTKNNAEGYAAQVTTFGAVLSDSKKVKEGYEFIKTLADTDHWMHLDLSVNRERIDETLNDLASTYYEFYPGFGLMDPSFEIEEYEDSYQIKPMSEETKEYLLYMIDHIETANLPEFELNQIVTTAIEEYLWGEVETIDEAYDNAIARLAELGYQK